MKNKVLVVLFLIIIYGFFILNLLLPDLDISTSERRNLQSFPDVSFSSLFNGDFTDEFEDYSVDQFVFRDSFRSLKANYSFKVLGMLDNNGYLIKDNVIYKSNYPTNKKSINSFVIKMKKLEEYFTDNDVYIGIIPDKNYYLDDDRYLKIDYDYLYKYVKDNLNFKYIELRDCLELESYYSTDTHWRQEKLEDVVKVINDNMGMKTNFKYDVEEYYPFYGVYYGQAAVNVEADTLRFLTSDLFDDVVVDNYEKDDVLYNLDLLDSLDSYDVYLSGASSLITLTNTSSESDRELVIIRDSFGSSLAPLLIDNYKSITLIDLRYMSIDIMKEMVDFTDKDVLILYSTLLVNDSSSLKIY